MFELNLYISFRSTVQICRQFLLALIHLVCLGYFKHTMTDQITELLQRKQAFAIFLMWKHGYRDKKYICLLTTVLQQFLIWEKAAEYYTILEVDEVKVAWQFHLCWSVTNSNTIFISGRVAFVLHLESARPWRFNRRLQVFMVIIFTQNKLTLKIQVASC